MSRFFALVLSAMLVTLTWAATPKKAPAKKTPSKTAAKSSAKKAPAKAPAKSSSKAAAKKAPVRRTATTWRNRQMAPTPDRYREIQQALVSKGYLQPENATGVWNQASVDALKKFQAEQNIESSGKINSLSLIALGLGPKRDTAPVKPPPPAPAQVQ